MICNNKKQLFLLRHAQAENIDALKIDADRHLTKTGEKNAFNIGKYLKKEVEQIDKILCSPAKRTKQTLENLNMNYKNSEFIPSIYGSQTNTLFKLIQSQKKSIMNLLLIGHNPSITQLASFFYGKYISEIPTCGLIKIEFNVKSWVDISDKTKTLFKYHYPKN